MISAKALEVIKQFPDKYVSYEQSKNSSFDDQLKSWEDSCEKLIFKDIDYEEIYVESVKIEKNIPKRSKDNTYIVHFHGGGFINGSIKTHRNFCSNLAMKTGVQVWNVGYTLATKEQYPFQENEGKKIAEYILNKNIDLIIGGDSSGGALALAVTNNIINEKIGKPQLLYLLSPWLDLTLSGNSIKELDSIDPLVYEEDLALDARIYCGKLHPIDASPLFCNTLHEYNVYIDVGSNEILLDDSKRFYEKVTAEHSNVKFTIRNGLWHTYQLWASDIPETNEAIDELVNSINDSLR